MTQQQEAAGAAPVVGTVRASAFAGIFDCAYRWYLQQIVGMRKPASFPMHLGTSIHAGTAHFDADRLAGKIPYLDEAEEVFAERLKNPEEDVERTADDMPQANAIAVGIKLLGKYCREISPRYQFAAVEADLGALEIYTKYGVIVVTGRSDRIRVRREPGDLRSIQDVKTGARAAHKDGTADVGAHHIQLGIYRLIEKVRTGAAFAAADEIVGLQTTATASVGVSQVLRPDHCLIGTDTAPGLIELGARMLRDGIFPPNPKSMTCGEKYCAGWKVCPYHA